MNSVSGKKSRNQLIYLNHCKYLILSRCQVTSSASFTGWFEWSWCWSCKEHNFVWHKVHHITGPYERYGRRQMLSILSQQRRCWKERNYIFKSIVLLKNHPYHAKVKKKNLLMSCHSFFSLSFLIGVNEPQANRYSTVHWIGLTTGKFILRCWQCQNLSSITMELSKNHTICGATLSINVFDFQLFLHHTESGMFSCQSCSTESDGWSYRRYWRRGVQARWVLQKLRHCLCNVLYNGAATEDKFHMSRGGYQVLFRRRVWILRVHVCRPGESRVCWVSTSRRPYYCAMYIGFHLQWGKNILRRTYTSLIQMFIYNEHPLTYK